MLCLIRKIGQVGGFCAGFSSKGGGFRLTALRHWITRNPAKAKEVFLLGHKDTTPPEEDDTDPVVVLTGHGADPVVVRSPLVVLQGEGRKHFRLAKSRTHRRGAGRPNRWNGGVRKSSTWFHRLVYPGQLYVVFC